jgi:hypothetical protein
MTNMFELTFEANIAQCTLREYLTNRTLHTNLMSLPEEEFAMAEEKRLRPQRLQIMLNSDELVAVDDFRFKKRMPSRAAAVRELLKRGLAAEGFSLAAVGAKSSAFGVTGKAPTGRQ